MSVPVPTWSLLVWTLVVSLFVIGSRLLTVFPVLYRMRLGHRISLLTAIHLAQISELSLVLLAIGLSAGDVAPESGSILAFAFALLAVDATYTLLKSDSIVRWVSPWLTRVGLPDLPARESDTLFFQRPSRIFILGFSWAASSLLEEITREKPALLPELCVVDFNPLVVERLRDRGVRVVYGDISQRNTLEHAGVPQAEVLICSLPDTVLKGTTNLKLLRLLRELNPRAQILVQAEKLADVPALYAAGASFVHVPRLLEAAELLRALDAAENNLLDQMRKAQNEVIQNRREIIS
jgi:Trk K+ transport system NAD-binding subunit